MVRKNSGKLEAFDREKLRRSIKLACRNREVGDEQIEKLVTSIHRRLETETADDTVTSVTVVFFICANFSIRVAPGIS